MFVAKLEFRPIPNVKENEEKEVMYALKCVFPNDLGRVSHLDLKNKSSNDHIDEENNHEWCLISRTIFMDHFLDEPLNDRCRMVHLNELKQLKTVRWYQEESNHMDIFIEKNTIEASEEDDLFHHEKVVFVIQKPMSEVLGKIQRGFDISQWFETLKKSFGSEQAINHQLIAPLYIVRDEDEFLQLRSVHNLDSVFVRCDGCSPKDVSADCLYDTTSKGWCELMDHIQRSTRCNLFFERMGELNIYEKLYIARPQASILKEMRCLVIDQILHYVIDEGNEGWSFVTGKEYIKFQDQMMDPIKKMCSLITKHVPYDNFTLDLGLVRNDSTNQLEWKVIELNTLLKGITGLGEAEDNIDLERYDHSFARYQPIVYADHE